MEREKLAREQEEKEKAEKARKMKESFGDTTSQWEKDKTALQDIALQEKRKEAKEGTSKETSEQRGTQEQKHKHKAEKMQGRADGGAEKADRR